ncbi:MAG TPA: cyclic nucleotide-binding domain-containing protein [Gaiellaceae bacterium]|nr:cyclic nucleotide-binding domain-containing protein [Gaiellaceae bacterium]
MVSPDRLVALDFFNAFPEAERATIAEYAEEVDVPSGTTLVSEGEYAYQFFVIEHGQAEVSANGERIAELGPGDFFGEVGLMLTGVRTATVKALSPMTLITLFQQNFRICEQTYPEIADRLRTAVADRFPIRAR